MEIENLSKAKINIIKQLCVTQLKSLTILKKTGSKDLSLLRFLKKEDLDYYEYLIIIKEFERIFETILDDPIFIYALPYEETILFKFLLEETELYWRKEYPNAYYNLCVLINQIIKNHEERISKVQQD